jgi:hypothetical protein
MPMTQEEVMDLLAAKASNRVGRPSNQSYVSDALYRHGFDKAALFLLSMIWHNLFEPWSSEFGCSDGNWWRCKGCRRKVKRTGRQSHYDWHKRELKGFANGDNEA